MLEWEGSGLPVITAALQGYDRTPPRRLDAKTVKILNERPHSNAAVMLVCRCLADTGTSRQAMGMIVGHIPWDKVMEWCDRHGVDHDIANVVWDVIHDYENTRIKAAIDALPDPG